MFLEAILDFFNKFIDSISTDLPFVIDDISEDDVSRVGVTWHMVRGETVWSLQSSLERQLWYSLESYRVPPVAIRGVTWLLQQFPQLAERL